MARPRKKRITQQPGAVQNVTAVGITKANSADRVPKSMVIRMGATDVGPSITQLVKDVRVVMEPHTAVRLRERKSNRLRDYTTMAGPLGVSHLLLFSRSTSGNTNLRIAVTPRGPTWTFRVEKYSLCRDVAKAQRHPKNAGSGGVQHLTPPLLVMNNFTNPNLSADNPSIPKHLESLTTSVFQSLFPPISPQRTPLSSIRRILLLNREISSAPSSSADGAPVDSAYILSLRHYAITTKPIVSLSRGLKRLRAAEQHGATRKSKAQSGTELGKKIKGALPNMSRFNDVADYLLDPSAAGFTSASESEIDTDAEVEVMETNARKVLSKRDKQRQRDAKRETEQAVSQDTGKLSDKMDHPPQKSKVQRRAVRLTEIGPRMRLRLVKVEEGLCEGKVMWHEFITKSEKEQKALDSLWSNRRAEKEERRRVQKENLQKKKQAQGGKAADETADQGANELDGDLEDEDWDQYEDMDDEDIEDVEMGDAGIEVASRN